MKKAKLLGAVFGVILFIALIAGFTYAWVSWQSNNIKIEGIADCFDIDYGISQQIGSASTKGSLDMAKSYNEGLSARVTLALKTGCNTTGTGTLYLNTNTSGTSTNILKGALKYAVLVGNSTTPEAEGIINTTEKITLLENIDISSTTSTTYIVYVWLDGSVADNIYANLTYNGYISAEVTSN